MGDIGKLDHRVTFQELTITPVGGGNNSEAQTPIATIWTKRRQLSSFKANQYAISTLTQAYEYEFRKDAVTPTKKYSIVDGSLRMQIVGIEEMGDGKAFWRVIAKVKE